MHDEKRIQDMNTKARDQAGIPSNAELSDALRQTIKNLRAELAATDALFQTKAREVDALIKERTQIRKDLAQAEKERDKYQAALLQIAKEGMERFWPGCTILYGPLAEIALEVLPQGLAKEAHAHHKAAFERWKAEEGAE